MLLANGPDGTGGKEHRRTDGMTNSLQNSFPAWSRRIERSPHRYVNERVSGLLLALLELEVGHAAFGCTSYATPGMEIALPPLPASHYTDPQ